MELMRRGPVPVRWAPSTTLGAATAVTPASDWRKAAPAPAAPSTRRLFLGDSRFPDHTLILGELIARHGAQRLRRTAAHRETQLFKFAAHFGIADGLQDLGIQTDNDVLRGAGRSQNRKPRVEEEAGQAGFRDGRHIRKL